MPRASFGGAQDPSQVFAALYGNYMDRLRDIERKRLEDERKAKAQQAEYDQDMMNRWQAGEVADEEWTAYVEQRIAMYSVDPDDAELLTYWKDVLRDSKDKILVRETEDVAQEIINFIESGEATWKQLLDFYIKQRNKARRDSPIWIKLQEQVDSVIDRMRDEETHAAIGRADYEWQTGKISGAEAGRRIREAAKRYETSDASRYWQLVSHAAELETAGWVTAGGSGGSRGGGGGSGGGAEESVGGDTLGSLELTADLIDSLNLDFKAGQRVSTLPDGTEVVIANEDGTPSDIWRQIDQEQVDTLRAAYELNMANGSEAALKRAGENLNRIDNYINKDVQPRNTMTTEQQFGILNDSLMRAIEGADSEDGARLAARLLAQGRAWAARVNRKADQERVRASAGGPSIDGEVQLRRGSKEKGELEQTTPEFPQSVGAYLDAVAKALDNPNMDQTELDILIDSAGAVGVDASTARRVIEGANGLSTIRQGLLDGTWARVITPTGVRVAQKAPQRVENEDGTFSIAPGGGAPMLDDMVPGAQEMLPIIMQVNGRSEEGWALGTWRGEGANRMLEVAGPGGESFFGTVDASGQLTNWTDSNGQRRGGPMFTSAGDFVPVTRDDYGQRHGPAASSRDNGFGGFDRQVAGAAMAGIAPLARGAMNIAQGLFGRTTETLKKVGGDIGIKFAVEPVGPPPQPSFTPLPGPQPISLPAIPPSVLPKLGAVVPKPQPVLAKPILGIQKIAPKIGGTVYKPPVSSLTRPRIL